MKSQSCWEDNRTVLLSASWGRDHSPLVIVSPSCSTAPYMSVSWMPEAWKSPPRSRPTAAHYLQLTLSVLFASTLTLTRTSVCSKPGPFSSLPAHTRLRRLPTVCPPPLLPRFSSTAHPSGPAQPVSHLKPSPLTVLPLLLMAIVLRGHSICSGAWTECFRLLWARWGQGSWVPLLCVPSPTVSPR